MNVDISVVESAPFFSRLSNAQHKFFIDLCKQIQGKDTIAAISIIVSRKIYLPYGPEITSDLEKDLVETLANAAPDEKPLLYSCLAMAAGVVQNKIN